jgi:hypothetical protein
VVSELRIAPAGKAPLGKKQKRFNTLVKSAADLRTVLRTWRDADYELHRRAAAIQTLLVQHRKARSQLVLVFDRYAVDTAAFTKTERTQLAALAVEHARAVLERAPHDADVKAVYNRHTHGDFDAERADEESYQATVMQSILEEHGLELDREYDTLEELETAARAAQAEREAADEARRTRRKNSAKQVAAEERKAAASAQAGKALQEIYRQLVRALHPDHEQDPVERARKTALMQEVNVAYERDDLLALLELQLRFEQIDRAHIGSLAEGRLDHFLKLLTAQVAQLREELATIEYPFRIDLDIEPPRKLPVALVLGSLRDDADHLTAQLSDLQHEVRLFGDPTRMKAWLRDQRDRQSSEARQFAEMMALMGSTHGVRRRR